MTEPRQQTREQEIALARERAKRTLPLIGFVLEWLIFRHLRTAPAVSKLVVALGVAVALPSIVNLATDFRTVTGKTPEGIVADLREAVAALKQRNTGRWPRVLARSGPRSCHHAGSCQRRTPAAAPGA